MFEDNPWWYNERASLSVLAGAAWTLKDWFALEEFSTIKRMRTLAPSVDEGHLRNGRCDLFIRNPNESTAKRPRVAGKADRRREIPTPPWVALSDGNAGVIGRIENG